MKKRFKVYWSPKKWSTKSKYYPNGYRGFIVPGEYFTVREVDKTSMSIGSYIFAREDEKEISIFVKNMFETLVNTLYEEFSGRRKQDVFRAIQDEEFRDDASFYGVDSLRPYAMLVAKMCDLVCIGT